MTYRLAERKRHTWAKTARQISVGRFSLRKKRMSVAFWEHQIFHWRSPAMDYTEFKLEVRITSSSILQGVERGREEKWFIRSARWRGFWMCRHQRCGIMTKKGCFRSWSVLPAESVLQGFAEYYSANPTEKVNRGNGFCGSDMDLAIEPTEISWVSRSTDFLCMENCLKE